MIDKNLVQSRFAKNLKSYNEHAKIQKRMANRLTELIKSKNPKKILEIGCGTGFLTELVSNNLDYEIYTAVDIVEDCYSFIKDINPKIDFIPDDFENFLKNNNEKYDLIVSNATLQWVDNFESVINKLQHRLNQNGELIFSTFGKENFKEIYHVMGTSLNYYSPEELRQIIQNSSIEQEVHIMAFNSPKDVLKHLQLTGVNAIENTSWTKSDLIKFENGYKNLCNKPTLTYNPIYVRYSK